MAEIVVGVSLYKNGAFLADCLESVRAQPFSDWELVIVDDGSPDEAWRIAARFAQEDRRIRLVRQENRGVAGARNRALAFLGSDTKYVLLLDGDDVLYPDALGRLRHVLDRDPAASAAYGMARPVDALGVPLSNDVTTAYGYDRYRVRGNRLETVAPHEATDFACFVVWCTIETPGQVLIRADALKAAGGGGFDPSVAPSDDWDLWLRLTRGGAHFARTLDFTLDKRAHAANASLDCRKMRSAEAALRSKLAFGEGYDETQRRIARSGHLCACHLKLGWVKRDFRLKNIYRGGCGYLDYLKTRDDFCSRPAAAGS